MKLLAVFFKWKMETIGYLEKFYTYKVASLPLEVTLRHCFIAVNGDPDGRKVQTGLADWVDRACDMGRFLEFSIPVVACNIPNPSFIPAYPMSLILIFLEDFV
jgi:hypothetical protein